MPSRSRQLSWRRIEIMGIIELLGWIHARGGSLASLTQADVDEWLTGGARPFLHDFLKWAGRGGQSRRLMAPGPPPGALNPQALIDDERWRLFADVTSEASIDTHTKFAAGLMLMFGVRASSYAPRTSSSRNRLWSSAPWGRTARAPSRTRSGRRWSGQQSHRAQDVR